MLLSAPPHSAERFSAPASGIRSLLVAHDAGRGVVTRAAAAVASRGDTARSCDGGGEDVVGASGDEATIGQSEDIKKARDGEEAGSTEEADEEELDGFWVSYGRRRSRRLLPPPIPSLVARGALRRTRTGDGRLVIRIVPVVRPECIRARRLADRLTMELVEHEEDSPMMAPPLQEPSSPREDDSDIAMIAQAGHDDTAAPALREGDGDVEEAMAAPEQETMVQAVPPPRVSSVGCFEDVFKYDSIGGSSLHQIMPSLRMVH